MRNFEKLTAIAILILTFAAPTVASAEPGVASHMKVDGSVTVTLSGITGRCSWSNGVTSDNPPNPLTIYRDTINRPGGNMSCTPSGVTVTLDNDPNVTFSGSTATIDRIDATIFFPDSSCTYRATNVALTNGSGAFTAYFVSGIGAECAYRLTGSITLIFH